MAISGLYRVVVPNHALARQDSPTGLVHPPSKSLPLNINPLTGALNRSNAVDRLFGS